MNSLILCFILTIMCVLPSSSILANEVSPSNDTLIADNTFNEQLDEKEKIQPLSIHTKLIKKAIRVILNNHKKAVEMIEYVGFREEAVMFDRYFVSEIAPELERLLKWSDVPYQAVHDAIYRGMIAAGAERSAATKAAHAVKTCLSWLF